MQQGLHVGVTVQVHSFCLVWQCRLGKYKVSTHLGFSTVHLLAEEG